MLNTFPVYNPRHASAALSYSRNAPNELGVRQCVSKVRNIPGWPAQHEAHKKPRRRAYTPRGPASPNALSHRKAQYPGVGGVNSY